MGERIVNDGTDLVHHPPHCRCLQIVHVQSDNRFNLPAQLVQSTVLTSLDAGAAKKSELAATDK